ncbi:hypothetical protein [Halorussus salinus]|uniref:hypothetical protein n=1 Tax=Halorussus salinus TaxID=1364935 RepID=UPI0010929CA1|nr:hypothetical protein [Halorussus salinus]
MSKNNSTQRRKVLKSIGSGLAVAGFGASGTVTAEEKSLEEIYKQARKIRQKTGEQEQFVEHLQKHCTGVEVTTSEFTTKARTSDDGSDVSTDRVKKRHMEGQLVLGGDYTHTVADYRVDLDGGYGTGEGNEDAVSISWKPKDYDMNNSGTHTDNASNVLLKQSGFNGALWTFDDWNACHYGCDGLWFSVGTRMKRLTTDTPRKVQATYQSVWSDTTAVTGMSVSGDGTVTMSVSTTSEADYEQIHREVDRESFETNL